MQRPVEVVEEVAAAAVVVVEGETEMAEQLDPAATMATATSAPAATTGGSRSDVLYPSN